MDYVQFRTSFRGFNKEDVVTFIDKFTKEKESQIEALKEENEQLRTMLVWSSKAPVTPKEEKSVAENVADEIVEAIADTPAPEDIDAPIDAADTAAPDGIDAPIDLPAEELPTNEEIERLQEQINNLNDRNAELLAQQQSAESLQAEIAALNERNAQLEAELNELGSRNEELLAQKQSVDEEVAALNDRNANLVSEQQSCGDLQAEINALTDRNSSLASEKELLEQRLSELTAQNDALLSEKASLTDALQQKNEAAGSQAPDYSEMELAAYRRAEETERLARERANRIYAEIEEALNNGSQQSEIDTNELLEIARSVNDDVAKLQEKVGNFRENYRAIGDTLREVGSKP